MKKLIELREKRAAKVAEMRALHAKDKLEDNEEQRFKALEKEVEEIDAQIAREERMAAYERQEERGEQVHGGELGRELRNYSLASAIGGALSGRLTGREAEIDQELKRGRESRSGASGIHLAVPSEILLGTREQRSQTVGSDPEGGYTVATQLAALGDRFRPALRVESMGATVMRGLTSFLDLPNLAASGSTKWVGENENAERSTVTFNSVSMGPKTVTGEYRLSRRLMLQSGTAIEDVLRRDLGYLLAQALDYAAINGGGVKDPLGILNTTGVAKVATVEDFADLAADLIAELELDDVTGTAAFLTNPTVMKAARKKKDADGHVLTLAEQFHNQRVEVSTQVPNNIGATTNKSALIYGQWGELYIGYWSAVDILINPYHPDVASNGGALLHAFLDADVAVRHKEAFAFAEV
ncbi:phage major capsid protein [Sinorhizobium meliloti WSM1022]|uniref:phage major capsid protein n=1 Tax=Rhizobium meliloti TaxID=382 RepID=UPI0004113CB7|nr:phage major capsid protein [Sinorhizobium meliloti]ASQ05407.1 major capsid protein [Sinorhizobium meliloti]MDW9829356.1 phage major capsid protein [Sinorhizobium meliloti]MDW9840934.1 phage major capsid protein [Sinorhizobium meliloti]MDX0009411.1 phage major capsid protein [Sinorhizobium meliloti]MDX0064180.1 phage major capsid protein [Sinorhizobium meliloti]